MNLKPAWVVKQLKDEAAAKRQRKATKPGATAYSRGNVR
jgi:hypothetical protein